MKKKTKIVSALAGACALALFAAPAAHAASGDSNVDLREHVMPWNSYVKGGVWPITTSKSSMKSGWNDYVSSLWVWSYVDTAILYVDTNYSGLSKTFVYGTDSLVDYNFNDMTSSVKLTW